MTVTVAKPAKIVAEIHLHSGKTKRDIIMLALLFTPFGTRNCPHDTDAHILSWFAQWKHSP